MKEGGRREEGGDMRENRERRGGKADREGSDVITAGNWTNGKCILLLCRPSPKRQGPAVRIATSSLCPPTRRLVLMESRSAASFSRIMRKWPVPPRMRERERENGENFSPGIFRQESLPPDKFIRSSPVDKKQLHTLDC